MKKELNGKSRRKFVVGGAMVFGSIALLSTGFATWVIGAAGNTDSEDITVTVEGIENKSVQLEATVQAGDTLHIADETGTYQSTNGSLVIKEESSTARDLKVKIDLKVTYSEDWGTPGAVTPTFLDDSNKILKSTIDATHSDTDLQANWSRTTTEKIGNDDAFVIFNVAPVDVQWGDAQDLTNGIKCSETTVEYTFTFGDIWGENQNFAQYVCGIYSNLTATGADLVKLNGEVATNMQNELDAIKDKVGNGNLKLKLEVAPVLLS